eukprot:scaffold18569_cov60-Cyclotella_meneghiniana.AAC.3
MFLPALLKNILSYSFQRHGVSRPPESAERPAFISDISPHDDALLQCPRRHLHQATNYNCTR